MPRQIDQCEQQIAGFLGEFIGIAAIECGLDLVGFLGITSGGILVPLLVLILGNNQRVVPRMRGRRRVYETACGTASKRLTTISRLVSSTRTVMSNRPS